MADAPRDNFSDLLTRLVRVPKREIDEQEAIHQATRDEAEPAKPRAIVPTDSSRNS